MFNGIEMAVVEPTVLGMQYFLAVPQLIEQSSSSSLQTALPHQMMSFRVNLTLIEYERSFTEEEMALLVNGVVARCMEDKWEVEFQHVDEPHVLFMRSWSRNQVFAVLPVNQDTRTCTELWVNSDYLATVERQYPHEDVASVFDLIVNHVVFGRPLEHQFVFGKPFSMYLWSWLGRSCLSEGQRVLMPL